MLIYFLFFSFIIISSILIIYVPLEISGIRKDYLCIKLISIVTIMSLLLYISYGNFRLVKVSLDDGQVKANNVSKKIRPLLVKLKKEQLDMRIYLSDYPNDHVIWSNLGQSYFMVQNFKQAKFSYIQALKLEPLNKIYFMNLITSNANLNKDHLYNKDELALFNFIVNDINNTHAINLIALHLYKRNLFRDALVFWKQILININHENLIKYHPECSPATPKQKQANT